MTTQDPVAPPREEAAQPPKKERDPWFDNAKMTLVVLVVVGHSWTLLPAGTGDFYDFLYAWHVPAFVLVTGYLSKSFSYEPRRMWALVRTVAVPYVIFEGLLALFRIYVGHEKLERLWANPHWPMWYLSALFFWRLMTPVFLKMPGKVVVAVLISLAAGVWAGDVLDMARIFGLLPFFVLGLKMHPGHWNMLRAKRARIFAVVAMVGIFVLAHFTWKLIGDSEWLYYRSPYDHLDDNDLRAATIRMCLLLVGLVGSFAFFALVPRSKSWLSALGASTLVVYLFHGFFVLGAGYAGITDWASSAPLAGFLVVTAGAVAVAFGLAWPPVARRLDYVVDPIGRLTRRRPGPRPA